MTLRQSTPLGGGEWMGKIADMLGSADKNLDQVKKSVQADLDRLKKSTDVAANFYVSAESGFKKDLEEIGIRGDAQKQYTDMFREEWQKREMGKQSAEILASPELAAMDGFITNIQNLPKLKAVIDSAEPESNWQTILKGFASRIPGLSEFLDSGGFDTVLTSLGLGFLVKPKKDKAKPESETAVAKQEEGKKDEGKPEEAKSGTEVVPENFKPGKTLVMGDSNLDILRYGEQKALREKLNVNGLITKGAMQSGWGVAEVKAKPKEFFQDFENVAIGFGTNDIGSSDSAEKIWGRLREIAQALKEKNPKLKIFMATIPPGKGNTSGLWQTDFESVEVKRTAVNDHIRKAKQEGVIAGFIDLAAKKSDGGLADDNDQQRLATEYRRYKGDPVHAKADVLADAILRTEYRETNEAKA